jgi:hypothetical protein
MPNAFSEYRGDAEIKVCQEKAAADRCSARNFVSGPARQNGVVELIPTISPLTEKNQMNSTARVHAPVEEPFTPFHLNPFQTAVDSKPGC